jgi:hypothetical protein
MIEGMTGETVVMNALGKATASLAATWPFCVLVLTLTPGRAVCQPRTVQEARAPHSPKVLRGSPELFRLNAREAPAPTYPPGLLGDGRQGLVVIEILVAADGHVRDLEILQTFDERASAAVSTAVRGWRFYTEAEMIAAGILDHCDGCVRLNRLAFDFRVDRGGGRVIDLAHEQIHKKRAPNPFLQLAPRRKRP